MGISISRELELERPIQDIRHEVVLNIVRTATVIAGKGTELFRRYDLTEAQFNVLFALKYKCTLWTQSDLGKRLVVTRASITSVLDKLESKGLVTRIAVPENRRIYHVELTAKGRAMINKVEPVYRKSIHEALKVFSDKECADIIQKLEIIRMQSAKLDQL